MIQAQIRLLKDSGSPLGVDQRERIIEAEQAIVDGAFTRFLAWLANDASVPVTAESAAPPAAERAREPRAVAADRAQERAPSQAATVVPISGERTLQ